MRSLPNTTTRHYGVEQRQPDRREPGRGQHHRVQRPGWNRDWRRRRQTIRSVENRFFDNGGLGIDLGNDGVTANDNPDADTGANNRQNFPTLLAAINGPDTNVTYDTASFNGGLYTLQFYAQAACHPSGHGEGRDFRGSVGGIPGGSSGSFTLTSPAGLGWFVTATATDAQGNTSEFSACIEVRPPSPVVVVVNTNDSGLGSLRQAIINANATPGTQTISFNIPGAGPGSPALINLASGLPGITDPVVIDGTTQPGYDNLPVVEVSSANGPAAGFSASNCKHRT